MRGRVLPLLGYLTLFQKDSSSHSSLKPLSVESQPERSNRAPATPPAGRQERPAGGWEGASSDGRWARPLAVFIWTVSSDPLAVLRAAGTETDGSCREEGVGAKAFSRGTS